jgi:hypothetical protein
MISAWSIATVHAEAYNAYWMLAARSAVRIS